MRNPCAEGTVLYFGCTDANVQVVIWHYTPYYLGKLGKGYKGPLHYLVQLHVKSIMISKY